MATTATTAGGTSLRVRVQRFGTFLSNMILPNIGAFIAWGLITALVIKSGWITLIGDKLAGHSGAAAQNPDNYGVIAKLGGWSINPGSCVDKITGASGAVHQLTGGLQSCSNWGGIVGPMITYLLPILIGYTGGKMVYNNNVRGGVVGAIATFGAIAGAPVPMFLGAMVMGPIGGATIKYLDGLWAHKIKPGFEMLVNNFSAGIAGMLLAFAGFLLAAPFVSAFSKAAGNVVQFLIDHHLLPLTSIFVEPAKVLFLNNAIGNGILVPLGVTQAAGKAGQSLLFLVEANPGPGLGLLVAYWMFGKGVAKASAPGAILIQFIGGIHEIYFPYVLMKPRLILALIAGGMTGVATNQLFGSGLRSPASPGSIIAVWLAAPPSSLVGVTLSVILSAVVCFAVAAVLLRFDRSEDEGDLAAATGNMEELKGKKSSVASVLTGGAATATAVLAGPIKSIVFACDAGMGSSAMGASVLRKKIQDAGFGDVTVINQAISNLSDNFDVVVVHQDLAARAQAQTPSAVHIAVDNFMSSPRYDDVVEMVRESRDSKAESAAPVAAATSSDSGSASAGLLEESSVVLGLPAESRDAAIERAGQLLVAAGAVGEDYVAAMHEREKSVSTLMGNGLAIPHGTNEAKGAINRSALSFIRYDAPVDWNGKPAEFVIGIAGVGNDHLAMLGKIAAIFVDSAQVDRLRAATTPSEVIEVISSATQ